MFSLEVPSPFKESVRGEVKLKPKLRVSFEKSVKNSNSRQEVCQPKLDGNYDKIIAIYTLLDVILKVRLRATDWLVPQAFSGGRLHGVLDGVVLLGVNRDCWCVFRRRQ